MAGFDYECDGQMSIFDILEPASNKPIPYITNMGNNRFAKMLQSESEE